MFVKGTAINNFNYYLYNKKMRKQKEQIGFEQATCKSLILRKGIRVSSSKLPTDFFNNIAPSRYEPKRFDYKKFSTKELQRDIPTPTFKTQQHLIPPNSFSPQRKISTANCSLSKDQNLIRQAILSARNLRSALREKSLDIAKRSFHHDQVELHLPKIKHSKHISIFQ